MRSYSNSAVSGSSRSTRRFSRRKMFGTLPTTQGELIEIQVLQQPEQGETFAGPQIVFPLFELGNDFPIGRNRVPFIRGGKPSWEL